MNEVLKKVSDAVTQESIVFEIDVSPSNLIFRLLNKIINHSSKKVFEIKPLTLNQLYRISKLLLPIDLHNLSSDGILLLMRDHARTCAEIVAISVTASRQRPSKGLIDLFFNNLSKKDLEKAMEIVLYQMSVVNFITTIASIRSLNILEEEANPQTGESQIAHPGHSSEAS